MAATHLLLGAAAVIERNGWVQDDYVQYIHDEPGVIRNAEACPVCPRAAIAIANSQHPMFAADWPLHCNAVPDVVDDLDSAAALASQAERAAYDEITEAETALARYIRDELRYGACSAATSDAELIEFWADEEDRTLPEILGALHAAAEQNEAPRR